MVKVLDKRKSKKTTKNNTKQKKKPASKSQTTKKTAEKKTLTSGQMKILGLALIVIALISAYSYSTATPNLFDRIWGKGIVKYLMGNVTVIYCIYAIVSGILLFAGKWQKHSKVMGYVFLLISNLLIFFSMGWQSMFRYTLIDMFTVPVGSNVAYGGIFGLVLTYILLTIIKKPATIILVLALMIYEIYMIVKTISPEFYDRLKTEGKAAIIGKVNELKEDRELAQRRRAAEAERQEAELEDQDYDSLFNPSDIGEVSVNTQYVNIDDVIEGLDEAAATQAQAERDQVIATAKAPQDMFPEEETTEDHPDFGKEAEEPEAFDLDLASQAPTPVYHKPDVALLDPGVHRGSDRKSDVVKKAGQIENTMKDFGVDAKIVGVDVGPSITRFEVQPAAGVKVGKIVNLADDLALRLATSGIRMEAPIPGKSAVGIEVPNKESDVVAVGEIIDTPAFRKTEAKLPFALGKTLSGQNIIGDISKMPHLLIAGATGSGKSVCINTMIISMIYRLSPDDLRFIMIDPKMVELNIYNGIPHMLIPVVTDPKKAAFALNWALKEMTDRYQIFKEAGVRNIAGYNKMREAASERKLPRIVIIVDELADLMMTSPKEIESAICRLAQLARACGMHLVIATQRPSVDVITGLIKANIPSRIAFAVASNTDSRTILDQVGAEKLLGKGDMLYFPSGKSKPLRVQGTFVSDAEINRVVKAISDGAKPVFDSHIENEIEAAQVQNQQAQTEETADDLFPQAAELAFANGQISTSMVQRKLRVGYARAGRIIDELETKGIISGPNGSKPRQLLITKEEYHG